MASKKSASGKYAAGKPKRTAGKKRPSVGTKKAGRKLIQEAPPESRSFLHTVIDAIPEVVMVIDRDCRIVLANRAARETAGGEDPAVGCRKCYEVSHHRDRPCRGPEDRCPAEEVVTTKAPVTVTHTHCDAHGREVSVEVTAAPIFDESGEVVQVIESCRDITERKRAGEDRRKLLEDMAERVKELRCLYGLFLSTREREDLHDVFRDVAALIPPAWHYPEITRGRILFEGEEYVSEPFEPTGWKESSEIVIDGRPRGAVEVYYLRERPQLDEGPFLTEERSLIGVIARALGEAVERRRAQEALRRARDELEQRVRRRTGELTKANEALQAEIGRRERAKDRVRRQASVLEAINQVFREAMTCETDREVGLVCLTVARELTGSRFGFIGEVNASGRFDTTTHDDPGWEACRMPESDAVAMIRNMEIRGIWGRTLKDGRSLIVNDPARHPDSTGVPEGHPPIRCFLGVPLKHDGKTIGMIGLANKEGGYDPGDQQAVEALAVPFMEALNRKRADQEVLRLNRELRRHVAELAVANKELKSFSQSVSHDLRAPLRGIASFADALREEYSDRLDGEGRDYLRRVLRASDQMTQLIEDLLRLSGVTLQDMSRQTVDLGQLAGSIAEDLRKANPGRRVEFVIADGLVGEGDERLLRLALQNLLDNAWKFTSKHPRARIELGATEGGDGLIYFVRDDGAGFDQDYVHKLFAPFQRLHSHAAFPGTGIGLATVSRIIHRHGGRVWAEGEVERGATFYFTL